MASRAHTEEGRLAASRLHTCAPRARCCGGRAEISEVGLIDLQARVDPRRRVASDPHHADGTVVERAEQGVVHEDVRARHLEPVLHDGRAARRNGGGLHVGAERRAALGPHPIEDLPDHVERRGQVRAAIADEEPHGLAHVGGQGVVAGERAVAPVEEDVGGILMNRPIHVEGLVARRVVLARGVEVALHHVVLAVHGRIAFVGLDDDQAIHAVGHVHAHRRGGAVIDVDALVEGLKGELGLVSGRREGARGAATRTGHRMQIDVVRHGVVGVIHEVELHPVATAHSDHRPRHRSSEGPEGVVHPVGDLPGHLADLDVHHHLGGRAPAGGRRSHRGHAELGFHHGKGIRVDALHRGAVAWAARRGVGHFMLRLRGRTAGQRPTGQRGAQEGIHQEPRRTSHQLTSCGVMSHAATTTTLI